jgi:hypothetical protein
MFDLAVRQIVGKRLTYAELSGKTQEAKLHYNVLSLRDPTD